MDSCTDSSVVSLVTPKRSLIPPQWHVDVRTIGLSECRAAALSLSQAFSNDELSRYLVTADDMAHLSPEERWNLHVDIMTYIVTAHCISGLVTTIGPDYDSVALWLPPGKTLDGWLTAIRSGLWRLRFQLSPEGKIRYDEVITLLHETKLSVLGDRDEDSWYLVYLGTKPCSRGRGHAKKLIEHVTRIADAENRPVYLESSSDANIGYYEKFGFERKKDVVLQRGPVPVRLSIMVREPLPSSVVTYSAGIQKFGTGHERMK